MINYFLVDLSSSTLNFYIICNLKHLTDVIRILWNQRLDLIYRFN